MTATAPASKRVIPNDAPQEVVNHEILVDGQRIPPEIQVMAIHISHEANRISTATLHLRDGEAAAEKFELSEGPHFIPGKKIQLKIGLDGNRKTLFEGIITRQAIRTKGTSGSMLTVECRHAAVKMTLGRQNHYFTDLKDSQAIEETLGKYGLGGSVESTAAKHREIVQHYTTDWDFIVSRAELNGRLVFADGGHISVKKPVVGSPVLNLTFGANILELELEMDARTQWKQVKTCSWDYAGQTLFEADSSSVPFDEAGNLSGSKLAGAVGPASFEMRHSGQVLPEELKAWADAALLKSRMAKIRGHLKITGFPDIKPGDTVELHGCGDRFNGKVFVAGVRQEMVGGAWFTDLQIGLSPEWFFEKNDLAAPPAGGLVPPVHGLQIGIAVELEGDPAGEDRILVRLPILDKNARGIWARICTPDAGKERGTIFRPEIGDELIVGFLNDDPRDAVVLGMAHSSAKPAWLPGKNENPQKGFQSLKKMRWLFDDEKIEFTIDTPGGNSFIMSEDQKSITLKDQHGNSLKMSSDGIEIKSIKDIKMEASANIEIKASANFKAEGGANADLKAGASLKANGGASAEFSSSGATQLKGSLVKIN